MEWDWGSRYYGSYYHGTWPSPPPIAGVNVQQNFAPSVGPLPPPPPSVPGPPSSEGTEGFILPSVTVKIINPDKKSEYRNYLIRDVDSKNVQTLNGVKSLLKEELGEMVPTAFDFDVGFYRGNKQV